MRKETRSTVHGIQMTDLKTEKNKITKVRYEDQKCRIAKTRTPKRGSILLFYLLYRGEGRRHARMRLKGRMGVVAPTAKRLLRVDKAKATRVTGLWLEFGNLWSGVSY